MVSLSKIHSRAKSSLSQLQVKLPGRPPTQAQGCGSELGWRVASAVSGSDAASALTLRELSARAGCSPESLMGVVTLSP